MEQFLEFCGQYGDAYIDYNNDDYPHVVLKKPLAEFTAAVNNLYEIYRIDIYYREWVRFRLAAASVKLFVMPASMNERVFSLQFNTVKHVRICVDNYIDFTGGNVKYLHIMNVPNRSMNKLIADMGTQFASIQYSTYAVEDAGTINYLQNGKKAYYYNNTTFRKDYNTAYNLPDVKIRLYEYESGEPITTRVRKYSCLYADLGEVLALNPKAILIDDENDEGIELLYTCNVPKVQIRHPIPTDKIMRLLQNTNIRYLDVASYDDIPSIADYDHLIHFQCDIFDKDEMDDEWSPCDSIGTCLHYDELLHFWHNRAGKQVKSARNI